MSVETLRVSPKPRIESLMVSLTSVAVVESAAGEPTSPAGSLGGVTKTNYQLAASDRTNGYLAKRRARSGACRPDRLAGNNGHVGSARKRFLGSDHLTSTPWAASEPGSGLHRWGDPFTAHYHNRCFPAPISLLLPPRNENLGPGL